MNSKVNFTTVCHKMWAVITTLLLFRSKSCIITQSNLTTKESFWLKNQFSSQHQNQEDYFLEFLHLSIITRFILFEHTVRKSEIVSKKNSKLLIWFFELKDFWGYWNVRFTGIIWIFAPKIVILCKYRINNNWKCWILTIFGVKIQILIEINVS